MDAHGLPLHALIVFVHLQQIKLLHSLFFLLVELQIAQNAQILRFNNNKISDCNIKI